MKKSILNRITGTIFIISAFCFLINGCAAQKTDEGNPFFDEWKAFAEKSVRVSPYHQTIEKSVPDHIEKTLGADEEKTDILQNQIELQKLGRLQKTVKTYKAVESNQGVEQNDEKNDKSDGKNDKPIEKKPLPTEDVSFRFINENINNVLRTLAHAAGINMVISEKVTGMVNMDINNASWDKIFLSLLRTYGLSYKWEGSIMRVLTLEDLDNELKVIEANNRILAGKKQKDFEELEAAEKRESKKREIELVRPLLTNVIEVKFSSAEKLKASLEQLLEKKKDIKRGFITVDEHTRSLIIQATQTDMDMITALAEKLDRSIGQVLIEAHIVETSKETARELGIRWGGLYRHNGDNDNHWIIPGSSNGISGKKIDDGLEPESGNIVNFPANVQDAGFQIGYVAQKIGKYILSFQLSALQRQGKLNILSSPSITTLDNQAAMIKSGKEVPYQAVNDDGEVTINFKEAVLSLKVTPHIIDNNTLNMQIETKKDELDFSNTVQGNPTIIRKEAKTNVMLRDGQTTVIGGLSKEVLGNDESGVPILKDIPLLGYLFKGKSRRMDMEEILIFVTPYVLGKTEKQAVERQ